MRSRSFTTEDAASAQPIFSTICSRSPKSNRPAPACSRLGAAPGRRRCRWPGADARVTCVELGTNLASIARSKLAQFPLVRIVTAPFKEWNPGNERFDIVFAATAWHWLDPTMTNMSR
jgi:trans-aconitate methyltransferase